MADKPIDRDKCRILISNDDGIGSPGIKVLEKIAGGLSTDVWVDFKVFGTMPLTLVFALSQTPLILRHGEEA